MITALNVIIPEKGKGIVKLINSLHPDKITVEIKRARGVCLKYITYRTYSGKIKLDKLSPIVGIHRQRILCSKKMHFPAESGFMRFSSHQFAARLCTNMALAILRENDMNEKIRLGIFDPNAVSPDILFYALHFCGNITVVTNEDESYHCQLNRAMDELGASAVVTSKSGELSECNLIIAPEAICEPLPIREDAVVLTSCKPKVQQSGLCYYKYQLRMPNGFNKLKPQELEEDYFCSALYTLENQYELGSIVPLSCSNESGAQTVKSICSYLQTQSYGSDT